MFYLGFGTFPCLFPEKKNLISKVNTTSRDVSENIYLENSIVHSGIFVTRRNPLTGAMTNFVQ